MAEIPAPSAKTVAPPIWILILVSTISPVGINIFQPSLPGLMDVFAVDYATVQLTLTVYLAAIAIAQLVVGPLSDRIGRRPVLLGGLVVFLGGTVLCIVAPNLTTLLIGRILQAAGGCTGIVLARAMVRDLYERREAASMIGYVTMGFAVAPMVSPMIGGILDTAAGWRAPFVFLLVFGAVVTVAAFARLSETNTEPHVVPPRVLLGEFASLGREPLFWCFALTSALASSAFFVFVAGAPYVMIEILGRSSAEYGYYFVLVAGGYMVGNFISGRFAARIGTHRMMMTGCVLQVVGLSAAGVLFGLGFDHPASLFGPMFVLGIANGMILPSALAGAISVRPELAGAASGFAGSMQIGFGAALTPVVAGLLDETVWPMLVIMCGASALAFVTAAFASHFDPASRNEKGRPEGRPG